MTAIHCMALIAGMMAAAHKVADPKGLAWLIYYGTAVLLVVIGGK